MDKITIIPFLIIIAIIFVVIVMFDEREKEELKCVSDCSNLSGEFINYDSGELSYARCSCSINGSVEQIW